LRGGAQDGAARPLGEEAAAKERYVMSENRTATMLVSAVVNPNQSHWIP